MKLIQIGSDRNVFDENSLVSKRLALYADRVDELHLIVFSLKRHKCRKMRRGNLYLYPTNTFSKIGALCRAKKIGKQIIGQSNDFVLSVQDPFEAGLVGTWIKKNTTIKLQIQIHTDFFNPFFKDRFLNKIRVIIAKKVLPTADGIRVVSERIKNQLLGSCINIKVEPQVLPIMNFYGHRHDMELKQMLDSINGLKIATLSRLEKEKNLELLLEVFAEAVKEQSDINLLIAGNGSLRPKLQKLARKLKIDRRVHFLGYVADSLNLFENVDLYIQTSNYEGFGNSLYEAKESHLPIITTDVGLVGSIIKNGEGALVCKVKDKECLIHMLKLVVLDKNLRESMREFNLNDKTKYLPQNRAEFLENYFFLLEQM